jgi:riboflavin kinase/FMN adenylyltransferase
MMEVIYLQHPIEPETLKTRPSVMALGYFDGVHNGHRQVIQTAVQTAQKRELDVAVMTFDPHPKEVLRVEEPMSYITPLPDKIERIRQLDVNTLYVIRFTLDFAKLTPQQYVDDYLIGLNVQHVVAGFDFTYGSLGKGTMETLPFHSRQQFSQTTVGKCKVGETKVSSSKIRQLLAEGDVENVRQFLGVFYQLTGVVVDGEKRGRTIGFPTANIQPSDRYIIPKTGVYAVEVELEGSVYEGVCNIGYKPTFHNKKPDTPSIEIHIFLFDSDIYGKKVRVVWLKRLREERKFSGVEELISQITKDKQKAIELFESKKSR